MEFHKKLYQLRKSHGLSQEELAEKLSVSRQTISKWELGESTPDMEKLVLLSKYFEISLDELVLGRETNQKQQKESFSDRIKIEQIFTEETKGKVKKLLKISGYILLLLVAIDVLSFIIYAVMQFWG